MNAETRLVLSYQIRNPSFIGKDPLPNVRNANSLKVNIFPVTLTRVASGCNYTRAQRLTAGGQWSMMPFANLSTPD